MSEILFTLLRGIGIVVLVFVGYAMLAWCLLCTLPSEPDSRDGEL